MTRDGISSAYPDIDLDSADLPASVQHAELTSGFYPYDEEMKRKKYDEKLRALQIELLKLQRSIAETRQRVVVIFEGRDAAGKGGAIKAFLQHLPPREARAIALPKPTEIERGQWYFQRYVAHLPSAGEIVLFDRSWYNRAGVERVMRFCTEAEVAKFFAEAPEFENLLVRDGIRLIKFFLSIGRETQIVRLHARRHDPLKQWKLGPLDMKAIEKYDDYTRAEEDMFRHTDTVTAPWTVLLANDKKRTRINALRVFLSQFDYPGKDAEAVGRPDPRIVRPGNPVSG